MLIIVTEKKERLIDFHYTPGYRTLPFFCVLVMFFFFDFFLCEKSIFWLQKKRKIAAVDHTQNSDILRTNKTK